MNILLYRHDENSLSFVPLLIWMFQDIQDIAILNMEQDFLERNTAIRTQLLIFLRIPVETLHVAIVSQRVPNGINVRM